ncbi:TPA: motility associated factor glycosyltransferase family protein [Campylobacter coli]|uniref:motility associated factor glycosyltransferase family protein n=1 Tax=Campylobacter jejuni TaxID=197 RepID=UPI0012857702|nr:motility associated factor glycosyltransferase family protein [Campylobacter jejuni]EAK8766196.1 motility associated factor glycosyltransferase family protein [Campylobacter coli]EAK7846076.1 motility associated factor glycosyltransferase family protein [Campylobacter jejuni]ECL9257740.1 motility associated factor glycosyltransferase family protein [Campylobacter jejuni]ECL9497050.1 motility associated factor glycosyltransferase family protein [Campylobacter jejuni]HED9979300.1 motility ass
MTFIPTQKELFNKNIEALSNILLKESLKEIKSSKFELILGKDNLDINLKDTSDNTFLYENVIDELNSMLNTYNDKYLLYPVLYFYGFGNGVLFKALLQNKNHQHIVVFEKDIEIIWIMFHILDFSHELQNARLIVLNTNKLEIQDYNELCSFKPFFQFSRIYFLELMSHYYERFHEDVLELNKKLAENFKNSIVSHGNDPLDALQGIEQFVYNLPQMITHPSYKELLSKRKGISDTAIIVSTGPSLTKQLPLLKKYASKATIFCADSSYPILAKHGIKPDYVLSLERIPLTSEFFNNDFGEFDKDIIFIVKSVTHPHTIKYLQKNNRAFILVSTYASFIQYLKLDYFGYFNMGKSVANMSYLLTEYLNYKNIILIGQDLAYAKDGFSHTKDYKNLDKHEGHFQRDKGKFQCLAYGGNGKVESSEIWTMFRLIFENDINYFQKLFNITTYNCTEGGARIEGTIEKPFLWACENLLDKDLNKPFEKLEPLSLNKQNEFLLKAYYKVCKSIKHCRDFSKILSNDFENIQSVYLGLNEKEEDINLAIKKIDEFKNKLEDIKQMQDLYEILSPLLTQFELNLARIYVLNPKTKEDAFNKSILWIKEHLEFMELVYGHIKAQENALIKNILPLEEKLKERKLDKWMERVRR